MLEFRNPPMAQAWSEFVGGLGGGAARRFALLFPLVLAPTYLFLTANRSERVSPLLVTASGLGAILISIPLFALAIDWGRWVSIHVVLTTVLCAVFLPRRAMPAPARSPLSAMSLVSFVVGAALMASLFSWSLNYCCRTDFLKSFGPIDAFLGALEEF
jgi:hypothetical protein